MTYTLGFSNALIIGLAQPNHEMRSSVMITPPDMNFDSIIVNANDGEVEVIKSR
jgi:hypothetical protein